MACYRNKTSRQTCQLQYGRGSGGILRSLYNGTAPTVKTIKTIGSAILSSPVTQTVLNSTSDAIKEVALDAGLNIVKDALAGEKVSESVASNMNAAKHQIGHAILDNICKQCKQHGRGKKRKRRRSASCEKNSGSRSDDSKRKEIDYETLFDDEEVEID